MVHIAYDKNNFKILGFIINDTQIINPAEVFGEFENYIYKTTNVMPPFADYTKYEVELEGDEIVGYINLKSEVI